MEEYIIENVPVVPLATPYVAAYGTTLVDNTTYYSNNAVGGGGRIGGRGAGVVGGNPVRRHVRTVRREGLH